MKAEIRAFLSSLESQPTYSTSTRLAYASDLTRYLEFLQGTLERLPTISDVHAHSIASFLENEKLGGKKTSTILRRKAALWSFKIFLSNNGYLPSQRESDAWLPENLFLPPTSPPLLQFLTPDQVGQLMQTVEKGQRPIDRRDSAMLALILHTGLSVSKLISLDLTDVNLTTGKLRLSGRQRKTIWFPLGPSIMYIDQYIKIGRPDLNPFPGETALFISQIGSRLTRQGVWQVLRHWGVLSNISIPLTPRAVRHTAALQLHRSGMPLAQIQTLLGHSNPQSTLALLHRLESAATIES